MSRQVRDLRLKAPTPAVTHSGFGASQPGNSSAQSLLAPAIDYKLWQVEEIRDPRRIDGLLWYEVNRYTIVLANDHASVRFRHHAHR